MIGILIWAAAILVGVGSYLAVSLISWAFGYERGYKQCHRDCEIVYKQGFNDGSDSAWAIARESMVPKPTPPNHQVF